MYRTTESNRTFGVEIEVVGITASEAVRAMRSAGIVAVDETHTYNHRDCPTWKVMTDGSVYEETRYGSNRGIEIVSPILRGDRGLADVADVVSALKAAGARVNETCGIHVHHGANDLSLVAIKSLIKQYAKREWILNIAAGRSDVSYSQSVSRFKMGDLDELFSDIDRAGNLEELIRQIRGDHYDGCHGTQGGRCSCRVRYCNLNFGTYWSKGTIEFRHHSGSVDAAEVCAWIVLTQSMIAEVAKNKSSKIIKPAVLPRWELFSKFSKLTVPVDPAVLGFYVEKIPWRTAAPSGN